MVLTFESQLTRDDRVTFSGPIKLGQYFTIGKIGANVNFNLTGILLNVKNIVSGIMNCYLYFSDSSGYPTGDVLSSGTYNIGDLLPNVETDITVNMSSYMMKKSTGYVWYVNLAGLGNVTLGMKGIGDYPGGGKLVYDGASWTLSTSSTFYFDLYGDAFYGNMTTQGEMKW